MARLIFSGAGESGCSALALSDVDRVDVAAESLQKCVHV